MGFSQQAQDHDTQFDTTSSVTWPAVSEGDVALLFDSAFKFTGSTPVLVNHSGFTNIVTRSVSSGNPTYDSLRFSTFYRICTGSESGSLTSMDPGNNGISTLSLLILRHSLGRVTAISVQDLSSNRGSGDLGAQTITAGSGVAPLAALGFYESDVTMSGESMSPTQDVNYQASSLRDIKVKNYDSSPLDVTIDLGDAPLADINFLSGCYFELTIAGGNGGVVNLIGL